VSVDGIGGDPHPNDGATCVRSGPPAWTEVFWRESQIKRKGKNGVDVVVPITPAIRAILEPLRGQHPEFVFTYLCKRGSDKRVKGQRYPLTKNGIKTEWKRWRKRARVSSGADGFRCHDFRHDLATKLLRKTGNLKLVQHALGHADIKTTAKYAHVLTDEVAAALESVQNAQSGQKVPKKVPNGPSPASQAVAKSA
jgi:integrase